MRLQTALAFNFHSHSLAHTEKRETRIARGSNENLELEQDNGPSSRVSRFGFFVSGKNSAHAVLARFSIFLFPFLSVRFLPFFSDFCLVLFPFLFVFLFFFSFVDCLVCEEMTEDQTPCLRS
jgi:hypothetical protein